MGLVVEIAIFLVATFIIMKVAPAAKLLPAAEPAGRMFDPKALSETPTELRKLENGIFMTKNAKASIIGAYWRVIVILKDPKETLNNRLTMQDVKDYQEFLELVNPVNEYHLDKGTKQLVKTRLDWLAQQIALDERNFDDAPEDGNRGKRDVNCDPASVNETVVNCPDRRSKRAILGVGGWILGKIFGLATAGSVSRIKQWVRLGYLQNQALVHRSNEMASTINQLIDEQNKTREYISEHATAIEALRTHATHLADLLNRTVTQVNQIQKQLTLNAWMTGLERKYELERRARSDFLGQKMALETGRLTQAVLPRRYLQSILDEAVAHSHDYEPATSEWYYEHCEVRPIWDGLQGLAYIVELPLTTETAVAYNVHTFPYVQETGEWLRLITHERIGYDQTNGLMTVLSECRGHNPMLCEKNLRFHDGMECERALIIRNHYGLDSCSVRMESPVRTYTTPLNINKYVLTTMDERVEVRCDGSQTIRVLTPPGSYVLTFNSGGCQVQGTSGWILDSLAVHQSEQELDASVINTTDIDIPVMPEIEYLPELVIEELHQVEGVQINKLQKMKPLPPPLLTPSHSSWNSYVILIILVILAVTIMVFCLKYQKQAKCLRGCVYGLIRRLFTTCCARCCKKTETNSDEQTAARGPTRGIQLPERLFNGARSLGLYAEPRAVCEAEPPADRQMSEAEWNAWEIVKRENPHAYAEVNPRRSQMPRGQPTIAAISVCPTPAGSRVAAPLSERRHPSEALPATPGHATAPPSEAATYPNLAPCQDNEVRNDLHGPSESGELGAYLRSPWQRRRPAVHTSGLTRDAETYMSFRGVAEPEGTTPGRGHGKPMTRGALTAAAFCQRTRRTGRTAWKRARADTECPEVMTRQRELLTRNNRGAVLAKYGIDFQGTDVNPGPDVSRQSYDDDESWD